MTTQATARRVAPLARVLAFALLVFVTYSSTVNIAHRHGGLLSGQSVGAGVIVDADTDYSTTGGSRSTGECLICQLHQHLFSTLLINTPGIAPPSAKEAFVTKALISSHSETCAPRRGRAPPETSTL
jgi:hypothetical protein